MEKQIKMRVQVSSQNRIQNWLEFVDLLKKAAECRYLSKARMETKGREKIMRLSKDFRRIATEVWIVLFKLDGKSLVWAICGWLNQNILFTWRHWKASNRASTWMLGSKICSDGNGLILSSSKEVFGILALHRNLRPLICIIYIYINIKKSEKNKSSQQKCV